MAKTLSILAHSLLAHVKLHEDEIPTLQQRVTVLDCEAQSTSAPHAQEMNKVVKQVERLEEEKDEVQQENQELQADLQARKVTLNQYKQENQKLLTDVQELRQTQEEGRETEDGEEES